ncbi:MAG: hypothetical protein HOH43_17055 [Candidatus Latescibacteria bacterium]|nr:hypothetical protein [Candidatus Latescibacterota bacterium]
MILLSNWKRGICFEPTDCPARRMYLWFYEWHLFDAFGPGEHTPGRHNPETQISDDGLNGILSHNGLRLELNSLEDGVALRLIVSNHTSDTWPDVAAIIPCFNPGLAPEAVPTEGFFDDEHERTWFLGRSSLELLQLRDIHFNYEYRSAVDERAAGGIHPFTEKWPTSDRDAGGGLLVRESVDRKWVAGIAWESYLSLQGHNPWRCMHQSVRIGPLAPGATREINGRIYLFQGDRMSCLDKYALQFRQNDGG